MKYGLPYKGSKNKLAERIVRLLPKRTHLVDLFCGGCAVSHAALLMGKYEHIHINDINWMCPTLFIDALNGKYNNENRWISREDFFRLKDTDPYVAFVWSFGNNLRDYLYSREIEPLKKAIHYAIFFSDYSFGKELRYDLSFIDSIQYLQKRFLAVQHYFGKLGHFQHQSFEGQNQRLQSVEAMSRFTTYLQNWVGAKRLAEIGYNGTSNAPQNCNTWKVSTECYDSKKTTSAPANWNTTNDETSSYRLQHRERQRRLSHIFWGYLPITSSVLDYEKVSIPEDSVIYCDIPYEGTDGYLEKAKEGFDYERFYQWCERQTQPVFISSYQLPSDRFDCIEEFTHHSPFAQKVNNLVTERIFVPKHQTERGNKTLQLSLF